MKRFYIFAALVVLALAVSCAKETERSTNGLKTLSLTAGVNDSMTKMTYTSDGEPNEGFTLAWDAEDMIKLYIYEGDNDYYTETRSVTPMSDASKASIELNYPAAIDGKSGVKWSAYIDIAYDGSQEMSFVGYVNTTKEVYNAVWDGLYQDGTEKNVHCYDMFYAGGSDFFEDLSGGTISFRPLTTVMKIRLRLPDTEDGTTLSNIRISGDGVYSGTWVMGNEVKYDETNEIEIADQEIKDHVATFYVSMWAGTISNATLTAKVGDSDYQANIRKAETTLEAGVVYTLERTAAYIKRIYKPREACTYQFIPGLTPADDWHSGDSYDEKTGVITLGEESESVTYVIPFKGGSSVTVTRINKEDLGDLSGDYVLHSGKETGYSYIREAETNVQFETNNELTEGGRTSDYAISGLSSYGNLYCSLEIDENQGPCLFLYVSSEYDMEDENWMEYGFFLWTANHNDYWYNGEGIEMENEEVEKLWIPMRYDLDTGRIVSHSPFLQLKEETDDNNGMWCVGIVFKSQSDGSVECAYFFGLGDSYDRKPFYFER